MNIELKPCPFCGGEAEMMGDQYPYVECHECGAGFTANHSYEFDEDDAASKWNARSTVGPNLKPIAESKIRQMGGDVCGVLVRKDGRLAAVDEHGRVTWLPDGTDYAAISSRAIGDIAKVTELLGVPEEEAGRPIVELVKEYLAAQSCNSAPSEQGKNRYGLDMAYFRELFNRELNRPLVDFRPDELARVLARAARTADAAVLQEPEFQAASAQSGQGAEPVEFQDYDAGMLNDLGGGNVSWWMDYLRAEIERANNHWREQTGPLPLHTVPAAQVEGGLIMWDHRYRQLEEGETVQEGDEVEISNDEWRDPPKWVKATGSIGHKAPCPHYPSHRKFRRLKSKEDRDHG